MNPFASLTFIKVRGVRLNVLDIAAYYKNPCLDAGDPNITVILKTGDKVPIRGTSEEHLEQLLKDIDGAINHAEMYMLGVAPQGESDSE